MFFPAWILLVILSLLVSFAAFLWGLRSGQFSDPERARYLPLNNEFLPPPVKDPSRLTAEVYALILVGLLGLATFVTAIVLSVIHSKG